MSLGLNPPYCNDSKIPRIVAIQNAAGIPFPDTSAIMMQVFPLSISNTS